MHRVPLILLLVLAMRDAAVALAESCVTCHANVKIEFQASAHAAVLTCTTCHGGDPTLVSPAAHASDKGYIGKPGRTDIPALCGSCHADTERMRASGLPVDQYAQYQQSAHGRAIAGGDLRAAVCTDCHGTHRILSPQEPTSPVARSNVPGTCERCHADATLMKAYGLHANDGELFRSSVHGVALLIDEHPSAPTCATCHGSHGAKAGGATAACGQCHARTFELLQLGPHARAVRAGTMSGCISCHRAHDVAMPDHTLFDSACVSCHDRDSAAFGVSQKLKTLLMQASASIEGATQDVDTLQRTWPSVARKRSRITQANAYLLEALTTQHTLDLSRVEDLARSARSISDDVRASVHGVQQEGNLRYLALALLWIYLLFLAGVTYAYARTRRDPPR
jgi:hypothetical protein